MKIEIELPTGATVADALATEEMLRKVMPNAGFLVTFAGNELPREMRDRLKRLLPDAKVRMVTL